MWRVNFKFDFDKWFIIKQFILKYNFWGIWKSTPTRKSYRARFRLNLYDLTKTKSRRECVLHWNWRFDRHKESELNILGNAARVCHECMRYSWICALWRWGNRKRRRWGTSAVACFFSKLAKWATDWHMWGGHVQVLHAGVLQCDNAIWSLN